MKNVWNDSESQLKPNTEYCIKARFKASSRLLGLESSWSEWSKSICWKNEDKEEQRFLLPILLKTLGPVCLTLGVLLFAFYNPATRMKIKTLAHTPTPAPFFKPLFQQHEGNLQEWLSPHGKQVLTYKTEEDLIPDVVTVLPKSSSKDFEENQDFLSLPTTQLVFPLSHTSYVGLPGMDNAFPPATLLCPGDTPYTQFPGSSLGFNFQEKEVFSSGMKDTLEISHCDSGCSCEDLTQSLECSLPCSPVDETPTPNHCNDYCILNKTAEGIIPILLSKQRARDVRSDSLKSEG
ncbi:interleukin-21 receptor-like [Cyprinodon tularosa]|uniref:interleukin-21 receptor-like n=1 Tax=Cyprinodon tularosa TaxID=77115 RepID=UPI0018E2457B|nr:interleukin-21 receptor-like [Cyprinodon tularosa]